LCLLSLQGDPAEKIGLSAFHTSRGLGTVTAFHSSASLGSQGDLWTVRFESGGDSVDLDGPELAHAISLAKVRRARCGIKFYFKATML
jgi:hypothetical protein